MVVKCPVVICPTICLTYAVFAVRSQHVSVRADAAVAPRDVVAPDQRHNAQFVFNDSVT